MLRVMEGGRELMDAGTSSQTNTQEAAPPRLLVVKTVSNKFTTHTVGKKAAVETCTLTPGSESLGKPHPKKISFIGDFFWGWDWIQIFFLLFLVDVDKLCGQMKSGPVFK